MNVLGKYEQYGQGGTKMEQEEWEKLSPEEKRVQLYLNQKQTLEAFLERGAISKAQFDKSLGDLTIKMGMNISGK